MNFALSFLIVGDNDIIRTILDTKGFLSSLFKLLPKDPPETLMLFLTTLNQKVIQDAAIPKKTKSLFFNTYVLKQISQLLTTPIDHTHQDGTAELHEYVFGFLLKLCTNFQLGICYKCKERPEGLQKSTNPVILHLISSLTGFLSRPLIRTLVLNTLTTCHDLIIPYVTAMTMNFDPQPNSKWVSSTDFITKLYSLLPPVKTLLCAESADSPNDDLPLSYLDVAVELTVPLVISRSALSHGLQQPLPLVKYQTLALMRVVLRRAVETIGTAVLVRSLQSIDSFLVTYADRVLKCLPDIKTLISLHQHLSKGVVSGCALDKLDHSDQLKNAELQESPDLLSVWLEVLRYYQTLSPTIFLVAGYNLTKLLPTVGGKGIPSAVVMPTIQLLTEAPVGSIKWTQKGGSALKSVLLLMLNPSMEIATMATTLAHKLLISMEMFKGLDCEVDLLLMSLRECHTYSVVEFVGGAILEALKDGKVPNSTTGTTSHDNSMEAVKEEMMKESLAVCLSISLDEILSGPCVIPDAIVSHDGHAANQQPNGVFPLLPALLVNSDQEELNRFKENFLQKLLLVDPTIAKRIAKPLSRAVLTRANTCITLIAGCVHWDEHVTLEINAEAKSQLLEMWNSLSAGSADYKCSVRAVSMLLWQLYQEEEEDVALVEFLFDLLSEALLILRTVPIEHKTIFINVCESPLIRDCFLSEKMLHTSKRKQTKKMNPIALLFSSRIGQLLSIGLNSFPVLKDSKCLQACRDKVFTAITVHLRCPDSTIDELLSVLLDHLVATIDSKIASTFIESILVPHSSIHQDSIPFLATVISILLDGISLENEGCTFEESDSTNQDACGTVHFNEQALEGLVKLVIMIQGTTLDSILYTILKHQLGRSPKAPSLDLKSSREPKVDSITSSIDSLMTSLFSSHVTTPQESSLLSPRSDRSLTQLLVTPSDTFIVDKFDRIYSCLTTNCTQNLRAKKIFEQSQMQLNKHCLHNEPLTQKVCHLSNKILKKLLKHYVGHISTASANIINILFESSTFLVDYFENSFLSVVSERLTTGGTEMEIDFSNEQVCILRMLLSYLTHSEGRWEEGAVKMAAKQLWSVCCDLLSSVCAKEVQDICAAIMQMLLNVMPKGPKKVEKLLLKWTKESTLWPLPQLFLALHFPLNISCLPVLEQSLRTMTELFHTRGREGQEEVDKILKETIPFVKGCQEYSSDDTPSADTLSHFMHSALKYRFTCSLTMKLLSCLVKLLNKQGGGCGFDLDTLFERMWSHSKFIPVMCQSHDQEEDNESTETLKECLIELLVTVVESRPSLGNTSHVPLLMSAYSASRSKSDRGILYLLFKYEEAGVSVNKHKPLLWGPAAVEHYKQRQEMGWLLWKQPGVQEVIGQLKRDLLSESIHNFSSNTPIKPVNPFSDERGLDSRVELYDPCFLLPLLTNQLDTSNLVDCRRFIDSGCLGYLITALSSRVEGVRTIGGCGLELFVGHLEGSRFREKTQVSLLLEVLRNTLSEKDVRLPTIFTAFFSTTASLLLHPESPLYSVVTRFLVYKPALGLGEIPILMTMLHSSSIEHKLERVWILQILVNGIRSNEDYSLYHRKRMFDHCLSLLVTGMTGKRDQALILDLLLTGVSIPEVAMDLVMNKGLMTTLELVRPIITSYL
ncbi:nucleolar pre-ribosomal-associated protein 1-like isoform X3 [Halichondria panicea]